LCPFDIWRTVKPSLKLDSGWSYLVDDHFAIYINGHDDHESKKNNRDVRIMSD